MTKLAAPYPAQQFKEFGYHVVIWPVWSFRVANRRIAGIEACAKAGSDLYL
ncbi:MAG: hypothetical protein ABNH26_12480 [Celeribacter sp.]|jgi:2-methylisocitrate lyase-like PEP mutase family enzyme